MSALSKALRDLGQRVRDVNYDHDLADKDQKAANDVRAAADLLRVLANVVDGKGVLWAMGAPGDWGYGTPVGDGLLAELSKPRDAVGCQTCGHWWEEEHHEPGCAGMGALKNNRSHSFPAPEAPEAAKTNRSNTFKCCGAADPPCPSFMASCKNPENYQQARDEGLAAAAEECVRIANQEGQSDDAINALDEAADAIRGLMEDAYESHSGN